MSPRAYHSPARLAGARATREAILDAATHLFVRHGYAGTTMRAIAHHAQVSLPTVQSHGTKAALLMSCFERAFAGDEGPHLLVERPELVSIMSEPVYEVALERYLDFLVQANTRAAAISAVLRAAAASDEQVRALHIDHELRRERDMEAAARWFAARERIRPDQIAVATDILSHLLSPQTYLHYVDERRWTPQSYATWIGHQLTTLHQQCDASSAP